MSESPPDRILTRKEFSRRRLVDDRHFRRAPVVTVGEPASGDERYSHRGEIVRRDDDTVDVVALSMHGALAGVVPALHEHRGSARAARQQRGFRNGRRFHPGHRLQATHGVLHVLELAFVAQPAALGIDADEHQVLRIEAHVDTAQIVQTLEEQPRAHEQYDRDGHLHDQKRAGQHRVRGRDTAAGFLQRAAHVHLRGAQRRCNAENDSGQHGHT